MSTSVIKLIEQSGLAAMNSLLNALPVPRVIVLAVRLLSLEASPLLLAVILTEAEAVELGAFSIGAQRWKGPGHDARRVWGVIITLRASTDDLEALDTLLDHHADIEAPGAVIGGGTALADAVAFGALPAVWSSAAL